MSGRRTEHDPVPQPHGGALIPGRGGGPQPGSGRPPSAIRRYLRRKFDERVEVLERIADGIIETHLVRRCEHCGMEPTEQSDEEILRHAARPADRIRAIEVLAKYGLGGRRDVDADDVRDRLVLTIEAAREMLPTDLAVAYIARLNRVWQ